MYDDSRRATNAEGMRADRLSALGHLWERAFFTI
jgi:hypothetical protein